MVSILDANILIYAFVPSLPQHETTKNWIEDHLAAGDQLGVPWMAIWAYLRITTNTKAFEHASTVPQALELLSEFLHHPAVSIISPGPLHLQFLASALEDSQLRGPEVSDAVFAAFALENGAPLVSADAGFRRFSKLKLINPLKS